MTFMKPDYDSLVGSIYDCAANPDLWSSTLEKIRMQLGTAYLMIGYIDMTPTDFQKSPTFIMRHTEWDVERFNQLQELVQDAPGSEGYLSVNTDSAWTQLDHVSREDFEKTALYRDWAAPQGLKDCVTVQYIARPKLVGVLSGAVHKSFGDTITFEQRQLVELLSPHVRRAVMINDIVDKGNLAQAIYRKVLDGLSTAVFVVGYGRRLAFTNAAGDEMLSQGEYLVGTGGILQTRQEASQLPLLDHAIERALKGDTAIGITGIGVPLVGTDGDRVAAYVLPLTGKDVRGAMGAGHCAVFVAKRGEQQPMAMEILRTLFDLTVSEARVALLVAKGDGPQVIAEALGITVNTVRSHLKHCFAKTGTADQTGLSGAVNTLLPPVK